MSIFSKKQSIQGLIKELEEDKEKLEYLLVHVNLLKNTHKIAFNKTHIKEQRFLIMKQLQGLVHEMSEELEKINKNLPKKIDFDNIKEHEEKISKFNEDYDKLINDIKTENEYHKKILDEISKEENFEDKERNLEIDLEKELKIDNKIIEDLQELNKDVEENLKFYNDYFNKLGTEIKDLHQNNNYILSKKIKKNALEIQKNIILMFEICDTSNSKFNSNIYFSHLIKNIQNSIEELSKICIKKYDGNANKVYKEIYQFVISIDKKNGDGIFKYNQNKIENKPSIEDLKLEYQKITEIYPFLEDKNNIAKDKIIIFFILKASMYNYVAISKDNTNNKILLDDLKKDKIINDLESLILFLNFNDDRYSSDWKICHLNYILYKYLKKNNLNSKKKIISFFNLVKRLSKKLEGGVVFRVHIDIFGFYYFISYNNLKILLKIFKNKINRDNSFYNIDLKHILLKFAANQEFNERIIESIKKKLIPTLEEDKRIYNIFLEILRDDKWDGISSHGKLFNPKLERSKLFILKVIAMLSNRKDFVLFYVQSKSMPIQNKDNYQQMRYLALKISDNFEFDPIIDIIHRESPYAKEFITGYIDYLKGVIKLEELKEIYYKTGYGSFDYIVNKVEESNKDNLLENLERLKELLENKSSKDFLEIENEIKELFIKYENEKDTNHLNSFLTELNNKIKKQHKGIKVNPFDFSDYSIIERKLYFILEQISFETQMVIYKYEWFHKLLEFNELLNNVNYSEKEFNKFISSLSKEKDFRVGLNMVFNRTREIVSQTAIELKNNFKEEEYDESVLWGANTINYALFKIKEPKKASTAYGKKYIQELYSK